MSEVTTFCSKLVTTRPETFERTAVRSAAPRMAPPCNSLALWTNFPILAEISRLAQPALPRSYSNAVIVLAYPPGKAFRVFGSKLKPVLCGINRYRWFLESLSEYRPDASVRLLPTALYCAVPIAVLFSVAGSYA